MRIIAVLIFTLTLLSRGIIAQVSNMHISGSYDGVFTLSKSANEYKVAGSPYLTENWMYGFLELKPRLLSDDGNKNNSDAENSHKIAMIKKCDELIQKILDPDFKTVGLTFSREKQGKDANDLDADIEINNKELAELVDKFEGDLLRYLTQLKAQYQSELSEINKIEGLFRYNLYAQEFEMVYNTDTFAIRSPLDVKSISLSNLRFIYGFYIDKEFGNDYLGSSYFEVLNEGNCKLLLRHEIKIKDQSGPVTYNWAGSESDSFVKIKQLYFQKDDDMEVAQFKKSKKFLKKVFADKYYVVEQYIRNEKIKVKDEKGLIQIFNYYNNLDS